MENAKKSIELMTEYLIRAQLGEPGCGGLATEAFEAIQAAPPEIRDSLKGLLDQVELIAGSRATP